MKDTKNIKFSFDFQKNKKQIVLGVFCAAVLAVILISTLALKVPVVPVCLIVVIEAALAVALHQAELWIHGILIIAELIAGIVLGRIPLMILCIAIYIAATFVLQLIYGGEEKVNGK